MPICQKCKKGWFWYDAMKKLLKFRSRMMCHHCGEVQFQSQSSRNKISLLSLLPIMMIPISVTFGLSPVFMIFIGLSLGILVFFLTPFLLKLTNEEESLW